MYFSTYIWFHKLMKDVGSCGHVCHAWIAWIRKPAWFQLPRLSPERADRAMKQCSVKGHPHRPWYTATWVKLQQMSWKWYGEKEIVKDPKSIHHKSQGTVVEKLYWPFTTFLFLPKNWNLDTLDSDTAMTPPSSKSSYQDCQNLWKEPT